MTVLRIAILGAESSGKSTLAARLAAHYGTLWVPEYLREFVEVQGRVPSEGDQAGIARTQMEREHQAAARANRFLFCDTTPMMTAIYSLHYWQRVDPVLAALDARHDYALTLVTAPDSPWQADGIMRESDAVRQRVHGEVLRTLAQRGIAWTLLGGSLEQRVQQAERVLDQLPRR